MLKIALLAYTARTDAVQWALHAAQRLLDEGVEVFIEDGLAEHCPADLLHMCETCSPTEIEKYADLLVTFGGDGTLLGAAHLLIGTDVPIMGVNVGKLGFLAEFPVSTLDESLMHILKGNYRVVDRTTLHVAFNEDEVFALNDLLIELADETKLIEVRAHVNEHHVADYRADGVLVATPTGSTAYSLAAGGPIIVPSAEAFCITPISPHTLTLRPLIVSDNSEVQFTLTQPGMNAHIVADGRRIGLLESGKTVTVRKGDHLVKLVKRADSTYYDLLREKLLWSADATRK
jgi:NAD+ kinase